MQRKGTPALRLPRLRSSNKAWHAMLAERTGQRASGAAGGASTECQNRRRLVARRGLRWVALGPPSASVGPPSACRLPPSVLSCSQAQPKSPLVHEHTTPEISPHLLYKGFPSQLCCHISKLRSQVIGSSCCSHSQAIQACNSV